MSTQICKTQSGSVYEIDAENKRVRRLSGKVNPTNRQGPDGEYKTYVFDVEPKLGSGLFFVWATKEDDMGRTTLLSTHTSPVTEIG